MHPLHRARSPFLWVFLATGLALAVRPADALEGSQTTFIQAEDGEDLLPELVLSRRVPIVEENGQKVYVVRGQFSKPGWTLSSDEWVLRARQKVEKFELKILVIQGPVKLEFKATSKWRRFITKKYILTPLPGRTVEVQALDDLQNPWPFPGI